MPQHRSGPADAVATAAHRKGGDGGRKRSPQLSGAAPSVTKQPHTFLYTPEQRARRDASRWTIVQGVLAPFQFLVFIISLGLVLRFLLTGEGEAAATWSIVVKTLVLYTIMITGAIWEKVVFGRYLFAAAFYWEDVFSMLVLALHTAYLAALVWGIGTPSEQMVLALAAYATYVVNATQFVLKLRAARRDEAAVKAETVSEKEHITGASQRGSVAGAPA